MSSRSFRRRNNRRRHRQDTAGGGSPGTDRGDLSNAPEGGTPPGAGDAHGQQEPENGPARPDGSRGERQPPGRHQGAGQRPRGRPSGGNQRGNQSPQGRARPQKGRAPEPQRPVEPAIPIVLPDCPVCGKQVRELASALTHRVARQPAHFECVLRELLDSNEIAPEEKICYLGGGSFGILEFRPPGGPTRFVIRKRIQYEEKETPQEWKKPLQVSC